MNGKRGWIRTFEAVIAILLVLGFILYVTPKATVYAEETPQIVESSQNYILKRILENENYRQCILNSGSDGECSTALSECTSGGDIIKLITDNTPAGYTSACEICGKSSSCLDAGVLAYTEEKSVYTSAIMVSSLDKTKVMRIYFWEK